MPSSTATSRLKTSSSLVATRWWWATLVLPPGLTASSSTSPPSAAPLPTPPRSFLSRTITLVLPLTFGHLASSSSFSPRARCRFERQRWQAWRRPFWRGASPVHPHSLLAAKVSYQASWGGSQAPGWTWVRSLTTLGWRDPTGQPRTGVTDHILDLLLKTSPTVRRPCSSSFQNLASAHSCSDRRWCRVWGAQPSRPTGSCCIAPWSATTMPSAVGKWAGTWFQHPVPNYPAGLRNPKHVSCFDTRFVRLWFKFLNSCAKKALHQLDLSCSRQVLTRTHLLLFVASLTPLWPVPVVGKHGRKADTHPGKSTMLQSVFQILMW